jgi:phage shock protein C
MGAQSRMEKPSPGRTEGGQRRLYKSRQNRVIDGVCGGLGEYFDVDPTLFRVGWVILALLGGSGIVAYIVAMIVMPRQAEEETEEEIRAGKGLNSRKGWGVLLIVGGLILLLNAYTPKPYHLWLWWRPLGRFLWPLLLVVIGLWILGSQLSISAAQREQEAVSTGARKNLYRSTSERMVAGVCGGLASFLRVDPSIVRILWVLATLASMGLGMLAYVIMWILVPERAGEEKAP